MVIRMPPYFRKEQGKQQLSDYFTMVSGFQGFYAVDAVTE
jgi:hypothetical protein